MVRFAVLLLVGAALPLVAQGPTRRGAAPVGDIAQSDLIAVARTIKSVRVEPSSITLRVGQTADLAKLTVTALDSSGRVRGRLIGFDFTMAPGGAATLAPPRITATRAGTSELIVRYPGIGWKERKDPRPEAKLKITVTP